MNMQEEEKAILQSEEEQEDEDGPPPGFQCIINPQAVQAEANDDEDDDGPPPGFDSIAPKPSTSSDMARSVKEGDDDEGPPPGWEFTDLSNALPKPTSIKTDIKTESNEELDEGPPPGWEKVLPSQMPLPHTPLLQSSSSSLEIGSKSENITSNDDELLRSESDCNPPPDHSTPFVQQPSSEVPNGYKVNNKKVRIKRPTFGDQPASNTRPPAQSSSSEKAQLVCCTCRKLCLYPRGAKWVQCPGCQEVNFVLEAHEVGQVKCGSCAILLMYPHGAPEVQCISCLFVTEIGAHNSRPPLSVQQAERRARDSNWVR